MAIESQQVHLKAERHRVHARVARGELEIRRALSRELHDRVAQTLTAMLVELDLLRTQETSGEDLTNHLQSVQSSIRDVLNSLRELMHDLRGDRPIVAERFGESIAALISDFERQSGIRGHLTIQPGFTERLKPATAVNLYRIIAEALSNVRRHSGASDVSVGLHVSDDTDLSVSVEDNGCGFDPEWTDAFGLGAVGMRERALVLGARLQIVSGHGVGTTVRMVVPSPVLA